MFVPAVIALGLGGFGVKGWLDNRNNNMVRKANESLF